MKKVITTAALVMVLLSCSDNENDQELINPTQKPTTCECVKETWLRTVTSTFGEWYTNGVKEFYSNDCKDDKKVVGGYTGQGVQVEYRIKCK